MTNGTAEGGKAGLPGLLSYLPPAWVGLVMLLSLRHALSAWPLVSDHSLPEGVRDFVRASLAASAVIVPWSLFLLALAFNRSRRFPRHFLIWQIALLAWLAARQYLVLSTPDFLFSAGNFAWFAAEVAIGVTCIHIVTRPETPAVFANPETERPAVLFSIVIGLLGTLFGTVLGFGAGLLAGAGIAELTDMSCFEGACGYFAVLVGLAGGLAGAIGGGVLAVRAARRKPKPRT